MCIAGEAAADNADNPDNGTMGQWDNGALPQNDYRAGRGPGEEANA
jgi:hypothetical protein